MSYSPMSYWTAPKCTRCDTQHEPERACRVLDLQHKLLGAMLEKEYGTLTEDQRLVIRVAGGVPFPLWGLAIATVACNPEAAKRMAAKLRAVEGDAAL